MLEKKFIKLLNEAGINVNGANPWDMKINSDRVFWSLVFGNLKLGETYMAGDWDCKQLDEFFFRLLKGGLNQRRYITNLLTFAKFMLVNAQKLNPWKVAEHHYDLGNDLFEAMLDGNMQYSCAYPKKGDNLELAQLRKLDLVCRKLQLKAGEDVLDIGCGCGGFAQYAAAKYGVNVTGLTVSKEQAELARQRCKDLPVAIITEDYNKFLTGGRKWDKIVSVGMFEHVGPKNYPTYMELAEKSLKPEGIFLLHTIGWLCDSINTDPWIERYIFPNGVIPSKLQIAAAAEKIFSEIDCHEFGACYDWTLMQWWQKFNAAWPRLSAENPKYDKKFYRMWEYYLKSCAGAFRARKLRLWQIVFTKKTAGNINYVPVR